MHLRKFLYHSAVKTVRTIKNTGIATINASQTGLSAVAGTIIKTTKVNVAINQTKIQESNVRKENKRWRS